MEININNYKIKEGTITSIICNEKKEVPITDSMSYVSESISNYYQDTIFDIMLFEIRRRNLKLRNPNKKIADSLKIVGLDILLLDRNINNTSTTDKRLIQLAIALLSNPEIIILDNFFKNIDLKLEKKLILLFRKIKDKYNKTIILLNDTLEDVYKYSEYFIVIKNNKVLVEGNFNKLVDKIKILKDNNIYLPEIIEFTYLAKTKKKVKIDYYKDIRDLIKDIYKHV